MKQNRKIWKGIISFTLAMGLSAPAALAQESTELPVYLNGSQLKFEVPPAVINGSTLVPLRAIFEAIGAEIEWNGETQTVTATKADTKIQLTIGQKTAYKNGQPLQLSVEPAIIGGSTLVPLRFIGEALGAEVVWNGLSRKIRLYDHTHPAQNQIRQGIISYLSDRDGELYMTVVTDDLEEVVLTAQDPSFRFSEKDVGTPVRFVAEAHEFTEIDGTYKAAFLEAFENQELTSEEVTGELVFVNGQHANQHILSVQQEDGQVVTVLRLSSVYPIEETDRGDTNLLNNIGTDVHFRGMRHPSGYLVVNQEGYLPLEADLSSFLTVSRYPLTERIINEPDRQVYRSVLENMEGDEEIHEIIFDRMHMTYGFTTEDLSGQNTMVYAMNDRIETADWEEAMANGQAVQTTTASFWTFEGDYTEDFLHGIGTITHLLTEDESTIAFSFESSMGTIRKLVVPKGMLEGQTHDMIIGRNMVVMGSPVDGAIDSIHVSKWSPFDKQ